jgi:hypothetical protein
MVYNTDHEQEEFLEHHDDYGQMDAYFTEHNQDPYNAVCVKHAHSLHASLVSGIECLVLGYLGNSLIRN